MGSGPLSLPGTRSGRRSRACVIPTTIIKGLPYLDGFEGIYAPKQAVQLDATAPTERPASSAGTPLGDRPAEKRARRQDRHAAA